MPAPYEANDPLNNVNILNGNAFPYGTVVSPRLGTMEEFKFKNYADFHPIHIHVNPMEIQYQFDANLPGLSRG